MAGKRLGIGRSRLLGGKCPQPHLQVRARPQITDDSGEDRPSLEFGLGNVDFGDKSLSALAQAEDLTALGAPQFSFWRTVKIFNMVRVPRAQMHRHQHLDRLAHDFLCGVAKNIFRAAAEDPDDATAIGDNSGLGRGSLRLRR